MNDSERLEKLQDAGSDVGAVAALIAGTVRHPIETDLHGKKAVYLPRDGGGYDLREWEDKVVLDKPRRVYAQSVVVATESLLREVARWPQAPVVLFVSNVQHQIKAVFNPNTPEAPGWGDHFVTCWCALSEELKKWEALNGTVVTHEALADLLEELPGIVKPSRGDLLGVVAEFRVSGSESGNSKYDGKTGNWSVRWEGGQNCETEIPEMTVNVPAFENEPEMVTFRVRVRPRVKEKKLGFEFRVLESKDAVRYAWEDVVKRVSEDGRLPAGAAQRVLIAG